MPSIVFITVLALIAFALWRFVVTMRRRQRFAIARFEVRGHVDDGAFLRSCGISQSDGEKSRVALAARNVIAELGCVPPHSVHPDESFTGELGQLPFWDSLDWLHYIFCVERAAGVRIGSSVYDAATQSAQNDGNELLVRHLVKAIADGYVEGAEW